MATTEQIPMPVLGAEGEPCAECGTPLAVDQRYCLNCGARRGELRLPYENYIGQDVASSGGGAGNGGGAASAQGSEPGRSSDFSPLGAVIGVALLGGMLLIGVLLGRGNDVQVSGTAPAATTASAATDTSGAASGTGGQPVASKEVASEWPDGKEGFTVELGTLPKDGTTTADVDAAKQDVTSKGASDVGVLDSDLYPSLPAGNYIIYSGVFDTKADADKALKGLGSSFPDAKVVAVSSKKASSSGGGGDLTSGGGGGGQAPVQASTQDLQQLQNATGDASQAQLNNIPDEIATPGAPPPVDHSGPVGAGTDAQVIK